MPVIVLPVGCTVQRKDVIGDVNILRHGLLNERKTNNPAVSISITEKKIPKFKIVTPTFLSQNNLHGEKS